MKLKKVLAFVLALALLGAFTVTAMAAAGDNSSEAKTTRAARGAWGEKKLDPFKNLLDNGVVSQATYEKMTAYLKNSMPQKTEHPKQSNGRVNILDKLLEAKIITQAEYDAMQAVAPTPEKPNMQRPAPGEKPLLPDKPQRANFFDKYVEDGIISEKTAEAIQEYIKSNMQDRPIIKESVKKRTDIYSKMLEAGVITQAEYDAIKEAIPERATSKAKQQGRNR